jgi:flagellar biogenesis protein FliO
MISRILVMWGCVLCLVGLASGPAQAKGRQAVGPPAAATVATDSRGASVSSSAGAAEPQASRPTESGIVPEYRLATGEPESSLLWDTTRMGLSLALVLFLLAVGVKVIRRWPGLTSRDASGGALQLLGRLPLTGKEAICLVRAGSTVLAVGVSPAGISLLHRFEGGVVEATKPSASGGGERRDLVSGSRFQELTAKIREVQTAWGLGSADPRGDR